MADFLELEDGTGVVLLESGGGDRLLLEIQGIDAALAEVLQLADALSAQIIAQPDRLEVLRLADTLSTLTTKLVSSTASVAISSLFTASFPGLGFGALAEAVALADQISALATGRGTLDSQLRLSEIFSAGRLLQAAVAEGMSYDDVVSSLQRAGPVLSETLAVGALFDGIQAQEFTQLLTRLRLSDAYSETSVHRSASTSTVAYGGSFFANDIVVALFGTVQVRPALSVEISVNRR